MTYPDDFDAFERLSARIVSCIAASCPEEPASLALSSPLSARNPDIDLVWHPAYRGRHRAKIILSSIAGVLVCFGKWALKLVFPFELYGYAIYGRSVGSLLVFPSICGYINEEGEARTQYVDTGRDDAVFVFGPFNECGKGALRIREISIHEKLALSFLLAYRGVACSCRAEGNMLDKVILLCVWLQWALGFQWLYNLYLGRYLSKTVSELKIEKIGCIHEAHSYARIVWRVAAKHSAKTYTIQHASVSSDKRWYYSCPEEIDQGLALPDVFYAFEERVAGLLKPYFQNTAFSPGCSCRYSKWKAARPRQRGAYGRYYLFVTGLARFDNEAVIGALRNLLNKGPVSVPLRLRMHSHAELSFGLRRWVARGVKSSTFQISDGASLYSDIEGAVTVIGMSSTVLEESLLMGCPVVQLRHPDYLSYVNLNGLSGVTRVAYDGLTEESLRSHKGCPEPSEIKKRFALAHKPVDYMALFSEAETVF